MNLLERPEQVNEGIRDLFARKAPWDAKSRYVHRNLWPRGTAWMVLTVAGQR